MRLILASLALLAGACANVPLANRGDVQNVTLIVGQRVFDDDVVEPVEEHRLVGIELDTYSREDPIGFELGFQYSWDDAETGLGSVEAETGEVYYGARKTFEVGGLRPYLGAGLSLVFARLEMSGGGSSSRATDTVFAPYAHAGVYYALSPGLNVGVDYRRAFLGEFNDDLAGAEVDYGQLALTLGWSF